MLRKTYSHSSRLANEPGSDRTDNLMSSCRLCLSKTEFPTSVHSSSTRLKLQYCFGLRLSEDARLPSLICEQCSKVLTEFCSFKLTVFETERKLTSHLKPLGDIGEECDDTKTCTTDLNENTDHVYKTDVSDYYTLPDEESTKNDKHLQLLVDSFHPEAPQSLMDSGISLDLTLPEPFALNESMKLNGNKDTKTLQDTSQSKQPPAFLETQEAKISSTKTDIDMKGFARSKARLLTCSYCQKHFKAKGLLERHIRIHTGHKPFTCETCHKSFNQKETLTRHKRTHEKTYFVCSFCPKYLVTLEGLRCHTETQHTVRDPDEVYKYKCKLCSKAFCHSSGLSRHQLAHTNKVFPCPYCPKQFTDNSSKRRHISNKHAGIAKLE